MTPPPTEGFTAACEHCGAPVQLVLAAPVPPCRYCGAPSPLGHAARARLQAATRKVADVPLREHRRLLIARRSLGDTLLLSAIALGSIWLVIGGFAFYLTIGSVHEHAGVIDALSSERAAAKVVEATWILASLLFSLGASISAVLVLTAWQRAKIVPPRALAPLAGGSFRCRLCGAALPPAGAVRTCRACAAKNLVDGRSLRRLVVDLSEKIAELEAMDAHAADKAIDLSGSIVMGASLAPLIGAPIVGAVTGIALGRWIPEMNYVWMGSFAPGTLAALFLLAKGPVPVTATIDARVGRELRVDGVAHWVLGKLRFPERIGDAKSGPPPLLIVVGPAAAAPPTLALFVEPDHEKDTVTPYSVTPGGAPLEASAPLAAPRGDLEAPRGQSVVWVQQGDGPARIFPVTAPHGSAPLWTLERVQRRPRVFVP